MKPVNGRTIAVLLMVLSFGCNDKPQPKMPAEKSQLKSANDLYWALCNLDYVVTKQKPNASQHGCKPSEYLAKKHNALFRVSVLHCGDFEKTYALVNDPKTKRVNALLRNHQEGGILQRGPLEIIVRLIEGEKENSKKILDDLGALRFVQLRSIGSRSDQYGLTFASSGSSPLRSKSSQSE